MLVCTCGEGGGYDACKSNVLNNHYMAHQGARDSTQIQPDELSSEFCAPFAYEIVSGPISYE